MSKFSATASAQGYLYQVRYGLLLMFKAVQSNPQAEFSLERLDDIAFEQNGDPLELIQSKHHVTPADLTDASSDSGTARAYLSTSCGARYVCTIQARSASRRVFWFFPAAKSRLASMNSTSPCLLPRRNTSY